MKHFSVLLAITGLLIFSGCHAVYNANRAPMEDLSREGTVVFTRPARFAPLFGSYSLSEFVEITYEKASRNEAGLLVVEIGIRYRGPVSWTNWDVRAPSRITLKTRCNFYENGLNSPIVYSTNRQEIIIERGETYAYRAICPVDDARSYQVVLGD